MWGSAPLLVINTAVLVHAHCSINCFEAPFICLYHFTSTEERAMWQEHIDILDSAIISQGKPHVILRSWVVFWNPNICEVLLTNLVKLIIKDLVGLCHEVYNQWESLSCVWSYGWLAAGRMRKDQMGCTFPATACPASLSASWLHPVLPSQILQLTCSLSWATWLCLTLPCPASPAASWCTAVAQEIATSLLPAWRQRCCWYPVSRSCTGFPRMLLQSLHQPASFLTTCATCISSEKPLECIGHDWSL